MTQSVQRVVARISKVLRRRFIMRYGAKKLKKRRVMRIMFDASQIVLDKEHYSHFLRLNNRKRVVTYRTLSRLGYPCVSFALEQKEEMITYYRKTETAITMLKWCDKNLPSGTWINIGLRFYFSTTRHAVHFRMAEDDRP